MKKPFLSVVIPAYNESERIGVTLADLKRYFSDKDYAYEVIVVSDGSTDGTADAVRRFALEQSFPALRVIDNKENRGKGYAVRCGMLEARGEYRLFMDADNSVTIDTVDPFLGEMGKGGHDVAIGSIAFSYVPSVEHNGWHRRWFGSMSKALIRVVAVPGIYDSQRGFKLFTARAADAIFPLQRIDRFGFDVELLAIAKLQGLSVKELPVKWDNPAGSKVRLSAYVDSFVELGRIYANVLAGQYDAAAGTRGRMRRRASLAVLFLAEFPALLSRLAREILTSKVHLDIEELGDALVFRGRRFLKFTDLPHNETALYTIVKAQKIILFGLFALVVAGLALDWSATVTSITVIAALLFLADLAYNAFLVNRSMRFDPTLKVPDAEIAALRDEDLPTYTILVPLYREWRITPEFLAHIEDIDYPIEKLDVILLFEERDRRTQRNVASLRLPSHFRSVIVPDSEPRTKARALNLGLEQSKGDYLVVYDADDMPERDQLKKALTAFRQTGAETVCVQAKLGFYNASQNVLTRMYAAEHSLWFDLTLPGLQSLKAPMPLAGASNHFRTSALRSLAGWDAFNVSEDWDLGIRLSKRGFKTAIIESSTLEEASPRLVDWYRQRTRWVKGYIQTYLVHMRDPQSFHGGLRDLLSFQAFVGCKVAAMLATPFLWLLALLYGLAEGPTLALSIGVTTLVLGSMVQVAIYIVGCSRKSLSGYARYAPLTPVYRFGIGLAVWSALWELYSDPHHWTRAPHGFVPSEKEQKEAADIERKREEVSKELLKA